MMSPPPMHPNAIQAAFMQMLNAGQYYIGRLGGPPLSILDWKEIELERWRQATAKSNF